MTDGERHEWKISTSGPPWIVIDWAGKTHTFPSHDEAMQYVERDRKLFERYAIDAHEDVTAQITKALQNQSGVESDHAEQAVEQAGEGEAGGAPAGRTGNRRSRRRAARSANSKKASGRGR